jgi:hypothetical protein
MPEDDAVAEALEQVLDGLADWIAAFHRANGRDVGDLPVFQPGEHGTTMVVNTDAPADVMYFWIGLPACEPARSEVLSEVLSFISKARAVCPSAGFDVELESGSARQRLDPL